MTTKIPMGTKPYNRRRRFQPAHAIEESAGHCSRKLCWTGELLSNADTNNVERHGSTTQVGLQGG